MPEKRYLLDLPDELLDEIVQHIYLGGGRFVRDVLPISLVCCRLRKAAAAILFHTLHVRLMKHCVDRRTFNLLLDVELSPYVASNVRHIQQHDGVDGIEDECEGLNLSNELVRAVALQALRLLQNARRLRCVSNAKLVIDSDLSLWQCRLQQEPAASLDARGFPRQDI